MSHHDDQVRQLDDQIAAQRDEIAAAAALLQAAHQEAGALRQDDSANMSESRIPGYDPGEKIQRLNGQPAAPRFAGFSLIPPPADGGGLGSSRQPAGQHAALRRQLLQLDAELENVQAVKAAAKAKAEALAAENQEVSRRIVDLDADLRNAQDEANSCRAALHDAQQREAAAVAAHAALQAEVRGELRPALTAQAARLTEAERLAEAARRAAEAAEQGASAARAERDAATESFRQERAAAADLKEQLAAAQLQLEAAQLQPRSATAVPVIATCDAACQAPPAPASEEWLSDTSSNWGTTGDSQHDGVAAAAQQIALHADAASRACQEAAHLQHQREELAALLAEERSACGDLQVALEALTQQRQPPAVHSELLQEQLREALDRAAGAEAELQDHRQTEAYLRAEQASLTRQLTAAAAAAAAATKPAAPLQPHQPQPPKESPAATETVVPETAAAGQAAQQEAVQLRRELRRAAEANSLLCCSLEAEAAAAAATHAADAAEIRSLSCQLYKAEQARIRPLKDGLSHVGRSAGAAESSTAKQEAAGLADHQLQACGECDALRQQLANEQAARATDELRWSDRLTVAQRDIGDLQARLSATAAAAATAGSSQPALRHFAVPWQASADQQQAARQRHYAAESADLDQRAAAILRARVDALEAELSATRADRQQQQQQQQQQRGSGGGFVAAAGAAETAVRAELAHLAAELAARDREAAVMKDILVEQRSLNQQLQAQLGAAAGRSAGGAPAAAAAAGAAAAAWSPASQGIIQADTDSGNGEAPKIHEGFDVAALLQRIRFLEAQNAALRMASAAAPQLTVPGGTTTEDYGSSMPHDAAELAALRQAASDAAAMRQRSLFLEAQNSSLRAAAAEAAAAAAPSAAAPPESLQAHEQAEAQPATGSAVTPTELQQNKGAGIDAAPPLQWVRWEEQKKLQRCIDGLRSKLREKTLAVKALLDDARRQDAAIAAAQAEASRQAAVAAELQGRLAKAHAAAACHPLPPEQVRKLIAQLAELEAAHDSAKAEAELLRQSPGSGFAFPGTSTAAGDAVGRAARELPPEAGPEQLQAAAALLRAQLEAAAAEARADRLQARLLAWFGIEAATSDPAPAPSRGNNNGLGRPLTPHGRDVRSGSAAPPKRKAFGGGGGEAANGASQHAGGSGCGSGKQALERTVADLGAALAKAQREAAGAVSTLKYMQMVQKAKQLQVKLDAVAAEAAAAPQLRQQLKDAELQQNEAQAAAKASRAQLATADAAADASDATRQRLQQELQAAQREAAAAEAAAAAAQEDTAAARKALLGLTAEVEQQRLDGAVDDLRRRLAAAEQENGALRGELSALDPEVFEEIEDLKWAHHQLRQRAAQYEGLVAGLAAELGRAPPGVGPVDVAALTAGEFAMPVPVGSFGMEFKETLDEWTRGIPPSDDVLGMQRGMGVGGFGQAVF